MAMMRNTTPGSLTGSLSASGTMSANITVGTVNMTAADMTNYYDKEEVDGLLEGKADVDHDHTVKNGVFELSLQEAYEDLNKRKMSEIQVNTIVSNYAAPIEHDHIVKIGMAEYDTQEAFDLLRTEIGKKANTTYVDNAINTALGNIESELDEIIGEEE